MRHVEPRPNVRYPRRRPTNLGLVRFQMVRHGALTFAWNFRVWFLGQMEQFISSGKIGSKYYAVPFVKNDPVELSRLVRFLQMVQLIPVISVETKKEELHSKAFLLFRKIFTGLNRSIWHFIRKKRFFGTKGKHPRCPWPFTSFFLQVIQFFE